MPKGLPVGDVFQAVNHILAHVRDLEEDEAKRLDPEWLAIHGPRFRRVEDALVAYKRYFQPIRAFIKRPRGIDDYRYLQASEAFLELSAACLKIAVDFEAAYARRGAEILMATGMVTSVGGYGDDED